MTRNSLPKNLEISSEKLNHSSLTEVVRKAKLLANCMAKGDRRAFAQIVLNMTLQPFHLQWLKFQDENRKSILLAPRGHGKTTIADILFVIWRVLLNPDCRVLIVSNTLNQSRAFLREIAAHLEREEIESLWGKQKGSRWTESEIELRRELIAKEPTITATGTGGAIISRHYDMIICDDILDEENSASAARREKVRTWFFKTLLPCLEPDGEIHVIGTRWHYGDLYGELVKAGWKLRLDKALSENGEALWKEKFSAKILGEIIQQAGSRIFNCQYQNDPSGYEGSIFKYKYFRFYENGIVPPNLKTFAAADLAISQSETADYFAHAVVGLDDKGNIYVLECFRDRLSFHKQVEFIISRSTLFNPLRIGVEAVAYQRALSQELSRRATLPIIDINDSKDKVTRAWKLASHFESGRVLLSRDSAELQEELLRFPHAPHDDQVDALGYAVELAMKFTQFVVTNY